MLSITLCHGDHYSGEIFFAKIVMAPVSFCSCSLSHEGHDTCVILYVWYFSKDDNGSSDLKVLALWPQGSWFLSHDSHDDHGSSIIWSRPFVIAIMVIVSFWKRTFSYDGHGPCTVSYMVPQ